MDEKNTRTLSLLGPIQIESDENVPRFRSQRTQALLGYLVAMKRPLARSHLVTLFWPNASDTKGKANLRRELHNLGRILPECWQMDQTAVAFSPDIYTKVDIYELEQLIDQEAWGIAMSRLRGDFLEGVEFSENIEFDIWLSGERERWRQHAEQILFQAAVNFWQEGNTHEAKQALNHLIQLVPWHEEAHRRLMILLARQGHFAAALKQYQMCTDLLALELGISPDAETELLLRRIKMAADYLPPPLPPRHSTLIGRELELSNLRQQIVDPTCRLLTITGLGGIGKSRLALEIAHMLNVSHNRRFLHGVVFVSLTGVSLEETTAAIGNAIGMRFHGQASAKSQLMAHLHAREMLLVLDNYEHLLPETGLVEQILDEATDVTLIVTSRQRLQLQEERVCHLTGLAYPTQPLEDILPAGYAAIQLFNESARRINNHFSFSEWTKDIIEICRMVEGLPLALVLASSWVEAISPTEIAAQIQQNLDFLEARFRNVDPRQQSMRAVFQATWDRLSKKQQNHLAALSVFRGCFSTRAAEIVAEAEAEDTKQFIHLGLLGVVDKQLTSHELIRQFAAEKLAAKTERAQSIQKRHAIFYLELIASQESDLFSLNAPQAMEKLTSARHNLIAAWQWAINHGEDHYVRLAARGFGRYYRLAGPLQEGDQLFQSAVSQARIFLNEPHSQFSRETLVCLLLEWSRFLLDERNFKEVAHTAVEAAGIAETEGNNELASAAYLLWGQALYNLKQNEEAHRHLQKAVHLAEEAPSLHTLAQSLRQLGILILIGEHDFPNSVPYLKRALSISQEIKDIETEARSLNALGITYITRDYPLALDYLQKAANLYHQLRDGWGEGIVLINLGHMSMAIGEFSKAQQYCEQTVSLERELGDWQGEGIALVNLALIAHQKGENKVALRRCEEALALTKMLKDNVVAAYAHLFQGHAFHKLGRTEDAINSYQKALSLWQQMAEPALRLETLAGMARVYWELENREKAQALAEELFTGLEKTDLNKTEEPIRIYLTCYKIFQAHKDARAQLILADAYQLLKNRAAQMQDENSRKAFLENISSHLLLRQIYNQSLR